MDEYIRVASKSKWHWHSECPDYNKTLEKEHDTADEGDPRTKSNRCNKCVELQKSVKYYR